MEHEVSEWWGLKDRVLGPGVRPQTLRSLGEVVLGEVLVPVLQGRGRWEEGAGPLISGQIKAKLKCL